MQRKSPAENDDPVNRETRTCQSASSIPSEKAELRLTLYEIEAGLAEVCEQILDSQEEGKEPDETDFLVLQEYLKGTATKRDNVARAAPGGRTFVDCHKTNPTLSAQVT